jgi:hypothetical protein
VTGPVQVIVVYARLREGHITDAALPGARADPQPVQGRGGADVTGNVRAPGRPSLTPFEEELDYAPHP